MAKLPDQFRQRDQEQGRIRRGKRTPSRSGKMIPTSIDGTIFTSRDVEALRQIADLYDGTDPEPWNEPGQRNVYRTETTASEIRVLLPADALQPLSFELWTGGRRRLRECDGRTVKVGDDRIEQDCLCTAAGVRTCSAITRLRVMLPNVRFGGVWLLRTESENAAEELPAQVAHIRTISKSRYTEAVLAWEFRTSPTDASREYSVPVLRIPDSIDEILGDAHALEAAAARQLDRGDDYDEATVVELPTPEARLRQEILARSADVGINDERILDALVYDLSLGSVTAPWRTLSEERLRKIVKVLEEMERDECAMVEDDNGNYHLQYR